MGIRRWREEKEREKSKKEGKEVLFYGKENVLEDV